MDDQLAQWIATILGEDSPAHHALQSSVHESPSRIGNAYRELLAGYAKDPLQELTPVVELEPDDRHGIVVVERIDFVSVCAHHFLPFFGHAAVAYDPGKVILGLGKLPRAVNTLARRFQLQEVLTREIVRAVNTAAGARGAWASLTARHLCISHRGPSASEATTTTTFGVGSLEAGPHATRFTAR